MARRFLILTAVLAIAACTESADREDAATAEDPIRWKLTSAFASSFPHIGDAAKRFSERVDTLSGGRIQIKFHEPSALAPALEGFDAVSYGAIEAAWSTPGYWAGKVPALQLFGAVPFGPDGPEYMAWFYHGGGRELFDELYARHNIHSVMCGLSAPEASGWFKNELISTGDLRGLKVRYFGLGAKVIEKLGASTQLLAGGDIFPALELGTIDGAEFSMPSVDQAMGFHQAANHYYLPGWHQQATFYEAMFNLEAWNSLSPRQQLLIETVCGDNVRHVLAEAEAAQAKAMRELEAKGVIIHRWPDEFLAAFETAWAEVAAEMSAKDEDFARAWKSLQDFRADYRFWRERGYLN